MKPNKDIIFEEIYKDGIDILMKDAYRDKQSDGPWYKIGETAAEKELTDTERKTLLTNSRDKYYKTPEGHGLIESAIHYIIGKGIIYHAVDENKKVQDKLDEFL